MAMKCVQRISDGKIMRIPDHEAVELVSTTGWKYVPKSAYKKTGKKPEAFASSYEEGRLARLSGQPYLRHPYAADDPKVAKAANAAWRRGWHSVQPDCEGEKAND